MNFVSGDAHALPVPAIRLAHGSRMFVAWGVLLPLGVSIARFTKHFAAPPAVCSQDVACVCGSSYDVVVEVEVGVDDSACWQ